MMAADNDLYAFVLRGFWMDIGQPKDFLHGVRLYLQHLRDRNSPLLASGVDYHGNVLVVSE